MTRNLIHSICSYMVGCLQTNPRCQMQVTIYIAYWPVYFTQIFFIICKPNQQCLETLVVTRAPGPLGHRFSRKNFNIESYKYLSCLFLNLLPACLLSSHCFYVFFPRLLLGLPSIVVRPAKGSPSHKSATPTTDQRGKVNQHFETEAYRSDRRRLAQKNASVFDQRRSIRLIHLIVCSNHSLGRCVQIVPHERVGCLASRTLQMDFASDYG